MLFLSTFSSLLATNSSEPPKPWIRFSMQMHKSSSAYMVRLFAATATNETAESDEIIIISDWESICDNKYLINFKITRYGRMITIITDAHARTHQHQHIHTQREQPLMWSPFAINSICMKKLFALDITLASMYRQSSSWSSSLPFQIIINLTFLLRSKRRRSAATRKTIFLYYESRAPKRIKWKFSSHLVVAFTADTS